MEANPNEQVGIFIQIFKLDQNLFDLISLRNFCEIDASVITKIEGVKSPQNWSTWFMKDPLTQFQLY